MRNTSVIKCFDSAKQKMIFCDPYFLGGSVYRVELVDFTSQEKKSNKDAIKEFESLQEA